MEQDEEVCVRGGRVEQGSDKEGGMRETVAPPPHRPKPGPTSLPTKNMIGHWGALTMEAPPPPKKRRHTPTAPPSSSSFSKANLADTW